MKEVRNVNTIKLNGGYVVEVYYKDGASESFVIVSESKVLKFIKDALAGDKEAE